MSRMIKWKKKSKKNSSTALIVQKCVYISEWLNLYNTIFLKIKWFSVFSFNPLTVDSATTTVKQCFTTFLQIYHFHADYNCLWQTFQWHFRLIRPGKQVSKHEKQALSTSLLCIVLLREKLIFWSSLQQHYYFK